MLDPAAPGGPLHREGPGRWITLIRNDRGEVVGAAVRVDVLAEGRSPARTTVAVTVLRGYQPLSVQLLDIVRARGAAAIESFPTRSTILVGETRLVVETSLESSHTSLADHLDDVLLRALVPVARPRFVENAHPSIYASNVPRHVAVIERQGSRVVAAVGYQTAQSVRGDGIPVNELAILLTRGNDWMAPVIDEHDHVKMDKANEGSTRCHASWAGAGADDVQP